MKNIKLIDLLNMIARGELETLPYLIKYEGDVYQHVDNGCYCCEETGKILSDSVYAEYAVLNRTVSVIKYKKGE